MPSDTNLLQTQMQLQAQLGTGAIPMQFPNLNIMQLAAISEDPDPENTMSTGDMTHFLEEAASGVLFNPESWIPSLMGMKSGVQAHYEGMVCKTCIKVFDAEFGTSFCDAPDRNSLLAPGCKACNEQIDEWCLEESHWHETPWGFRAVKSHVEKCHHDHTSLKQRILEKEGPEKEKYACCQFGWDDYKSKQPGEEWDAFDVCRSNPACNWVSRHSSGWATATQECKPEDLIEGEYRTYSKVKSMWTKIPNKYCSNYKDQERFVAQSINGKQTNKFPRLALCKSVCFLDGLCQGCNFLFGEKQWLIFRGPCIETTASHGSYIIYKNTKTTVVTDVGKTDSDSQKNFKAVVPVEVSVSNMRIANQCRGGSVVQVAAMLNQSRDLDAENKETDIVHGFQLLEESSASTSSYPMKGEIKPGDQLVDAVCQDIFPVVGTSDKDKIAHVLVPDGQELKGIVSLRQCDRNNQMIRDDLAVKATPIKKNKDGSTLVYVNRLQAKFSNQFREGGYLCRPGRCHC